MEVKTSRGLFPRVSRLVAAVGLAIACWGIYCLTLPERLVVSQDSQASPVQIGRDEFGRLIEDLSEPEGYFDTDNFISNETSYLHIVPALHRRVQTGGVYLGVGPDQNFSYLVHTKPSLAIVVDIRRQNLLQHLLYKALFELSANRTEYLCRLLSREVIEHRNEADFRVLLSRVRLSETSEELLRTNLADVEKVLTGVHALKLSQDDLNKIAYVYRSFHDDGLDLRFSSLGRPSFVHYPTFEDLLLETDLDGKRDNYLAQDDWYAWLKAFETENRLIPVTGDFAGTKALKAIGTYLRDRSLTVDLFYTSNVEFYLFGRPSWSRYVANLQGLPLRQDGLFIRAYFATNGPHPQQVRGHRSTTLLQPFKSLIGAEARGGVGSYWDLVRGESVR